MKQKLTPAELSTLSSVVSLARKNGAIPDDDETRLLMEKLAKMAAGK